MIFLLMFYFWYVWLTEVVSGLTKTFGKSRAAQGLQVM